MPDNALNCTYLHPETFGTASTSARLYSARDFALADDRHAIRSSLFQYHIDEQYLALHGSPQHVSNASLRGTEGLV